MGRDVSLCLHVGTPHQLRQPGLQPAGAGQRPPGASRNLASYTVSLASGQWVQPTRPSLNVAHQTAMDRWYAKITVQSGSGVFAFVAVIDHITNEPTLVTMQR